MEYAKNTISKQKERRFRVVGSEYDSKRRERG
jgi:hypothetical protein